eukprot:gene10279-21449_t
MLIIPAITTNREKPISFNVIYTRPLPQPIERIQLFITGSLGTLLEKYWNLGARLAVNSYVPDQLEMALDQHEKFAVT